MVPNWKEFTSQRGSQLHKIQRETLIEVCPEHNGNKKKMYKKASPEISKNNKDFNRVLKTEQEVS